MGLTMRNLPGKTAWFRALLAAAGWSSSSLKDNMLEERLSKSLSVVSVASDSDDVVMDVNLRRRAAMNCWWRFCNSAWRIDSRFRELSKSEVPGSPGLPNTIGAIELDTNFPPMGGPTLRLEGLGMAPPGLALTWMWRLAEFSAMGRMSIAISAGVSGLKGCREFV